jgi:hypothetical protein
MAEDTAYFLRYIHPDTNGLIDGYDRVGRKYKKRKHSDTLRDMGAYCEETYLSWRINNREASIAASYFNYETMSRQIEQFVEEYSVQMVNRGHEHLTSHAIQQAHNDHHFHHSVSVLRRAAIRSYHDLHAYETSRLDEARALANRQYDDLRSTEHETLVELRRQFGVDQPEPFTRNKKKAARELKSRYVAERRVIKRSVKLAEEFIGPQTTRMFIGGEEMQIEGANCTYVLKRQGGRMLQNHGGSSLQIHTKTGELLCSICIYTAKVPILDHVISLLLHIKAGQEDEILTVGNLYAIKPLAYEQEWLVPYLPVRNRSTMVGPRVTDEDTPRIRVPGFMLLECYREPDRQDRIDQLRRELAPYIFEALREFCAPMPATRAMLLSGLDQRRFAITTLGQQVLGLDRLPTNVEMARLYDDFRAADLLGTDHPLYVEAENQIRIENALEETLARLPPAESEVNRVLQIAEVEAVVE